MSTFYKQAQRRSILNKLKEMTNISGISAEKIFNPEFQRVMDSLRSTDNKLRSIVSGEEIENESAGADPISMKEILQQAKGNINRREYMSAISFLARFHKKFQELITIINALNFDVNKIHQDFLFRDLDPEHKKHLHDLKTRFANTQPALMVEASILDFLVNIGTEKGRALAAWEKRYPKQIGKLRKDLDTLYNKSDAYLRNILTYLKEMASYRATRKVDDYVKVAKKISNDYINYDKLFRDFYTTNVKGFLEQQDLTPPIQQLAPKQELLQQPVGVVKSPVPATINKVVPPPLPPESKPPSTIPDRPTIEDVSLDEILEDDEQEEEHTPTQPSIQVTPSKSAHTTFIDVLETLSNEHPQTIAAYIKKYAISVQDTEPGTYIQLMKLAHQIGQVVDGKEAE